MVKEEDGAVTVSLYEDSPTAATTTIETPAPDENKGADIKAPTETATNNTTEQSKEEGATKSASK